MYSEEICTLKKFSVHRGHYCIMKEEGLCPEHYALVKHCCHFYYYTYIWVYACCTVFTFNHMQYIEHVHFTIAAGDTSAALLFTRNTHFTNLPCYFLLRSFVLLFMQTIPAGFKAQCHAWSMATTVLPAKGPYPGVSQNRVHELKAVIESHPHESCSAFCQATYCLTS